MSFFFRKGSLQFLFILSLPIYSQTIKISDAEYKTILYGEDEIHSIEEFAKGSFFKNESDFIVCKGRLFKGNPPKSRIEFTFKGETILNMGEFSNVSVEIFESKNYLDAIRRLESLRDFDPVFFPVRYNLGRFYFHQKKYEEAEYEFKKAAELIPEYYRIYIHLAKLNLRKNKNKEAEILFAKSSELEPFQNESFIYLAEIAYKDKMESRVNRIFEESEKRNDVINSKIARAMIYFHKENYSKAFKLFNEIDYKTLDAQKSNYYKPMHYYFAVSAEKIFDKKTANLHFNEMLKYPFETIFSEIIYSNLEKKKQFTE